VVPAVPDTSLPQTDLQSFVNEAHEKICAHSHATRGNVDARVIAHDA
jgi:organic hydroperoxide reductase OsmC/OhrA